MIEYINNTIRANANTTIEINANITDNDGAPITSGVYFMLFDNDKEHLFTVDGFYNSVDDIWTFNIDREATSGLAGRYWYCICVEGEPLCFKHPFYLVK